MTAELRHAPSVPRSRDRVPEPGRHALPQCPVCLKASSIRTSVRAARPAAIERALANSVPPVETSS